MRIEFLITTPIGVAGLLGQVDGMARFTQKR